MGRCSSGIPRRIVHDWAPVGIADSANDCISCYGRSVIGQFAHVLIAIFFFDMTGQFCGIRMRRDIGRFFVCK